MASRHINSDDFNPVSGFFRILKEMNSDGCLPSVIKDSNDFLGLEILSDKD